MKDEVCCTKSVRPSDLGCEKWVCAKLGGVFVRDLLSEQLSEGCYLFFKLPKPDAHVRQLGFGHDDFECLVVWPSRHSDIGFTGRHVFVDSGFGGERAALTQVYAVRDANLATAPDEVASAARTSKTNL